MFDILTLIMILAFSAGIVIAAVKNYDN